MEGPFCDPDLKLIETLGWDGTRFPRLERHKACPRRCNDLYRPGWSLLMRPHRPGHGGETQIGVDLQALLTGSCHKIGRSSLIADHHGVTTQKLPRIAP